VILPIGVNGQSVDMSTADSTYGVMSYGQSRTRPGALSGSTLSDDEQSLVSRLVIQVQSKRYALELHNAYYEGTFRVQNLGISVPPAMANVRVAMGWPRVAVDALDERLNLQGFRFPDSNDLDSGLMDIFQANGLDCYAPMAHVDALVFKSAYVAIGTNDDDASLPLLTVESPLDFAVEWDARTHKMLAALRLYQFEGSQQATLYLPDQTVSLVKHNGWTVVDRDVHNLGEVLVERIVNRPRSYDIDGTSEITPELMSITDAACRTLLGLEVAREFYSAPQRYILGADEAAFQGADGTPKSGWETYMGRVLALEPNADGVVPTVGQFTSYDPATFTKVVDMYAQIVSSLTGLPPDVLGFSQSNPPSIDTIKATDRLRRKADRKALTFGESWCHVMAKALLVRDGTCPDNVHQMSAVWGDTGVPAPAQVTDAIFKQVSMGYLPATSDVVGEVLGYDSAQRARIEADRITDAGASFLQQIAHSLEGKAARVDKSLTGDLQKPGATTPGASAPATPGDGSMMPGMSGSGKPAGA
jgi:hypothetical protein